MDTKDLRCFRHVYEERSINQAAKQLFITPQGLSRIIAKLEGELQTELFKRTPMGMIPTESGQYFYEQSLEILYRLDDLKLQVMKISQKEKIFKIGFSCGVLNIFPLEKFQELSEKFPDMIFEWKESENKETIKQLKNGSIDLAFVIGNIAKEELVSETIYESGMTALVYQDHPYYDRESISIKDLEKEPLISLNEKYFIYHSLNQRCQDFGFSPNIVINTMESSLIYRFCKEKMGIGIDADIHHDQNLLEPLHKILIIDAIPWKISLVYKEKIKNENLIRQLKRIIKKEMICFYGVILLLPLSYQIIILCNLLLRAKITFYLFLIILIIQIVPLFISYLLSIKLYKGILPTSIIMEK